MCIGTYEFQEVEQLRQEKRDIDQQLRSIHHGSNLGSMQSLTMSGRRSDRGHSGGIDGRGYRGERGGHRGRGRGSRQGGDRYGQGTHQSQTDYNNIDERPGRNKGVPRGGYTPNGRIPRGGARGRTSVDSAGDRK